VQFTIRGHTVAIAVLAFLLALHPVIALIVIALSIPWLVLFASRWLEFRGHRRLAACSFGVVAALTNLVHPGRTRNSRGPIVGSNIDVYVGGGWWYRG
jgi:hypothetical protein